MNLTNFCKQLYFKSTGYSYTHLGRLFLRMFVGIMLIQFGARQIVDFTIESQIFPSVMGMEGSTALTVMICIEIICSLFIMVGFLTRLMIIPPFIAMIVAEYELLAMADVSPWQLAWWAEGYLPIMFLGIYFFLLLVGPGKISCDYFYSLYLIHHDDGSESDLEEV